MDSTETTFYTFEQNMRLIALAHDCVFINTAEKDEAIKLLEKNSKEKSDTNITDFFKQKEYISDKRVEYLLDFDAHVQLQGRDQQFGKIATANGFVSKKNVTNALEYQKNYFHKNQINMKIGNIMVGNGTISMADRISILLTQNRIKDENLLDALNDISETQAQKDAVNRRVGALAVKMELVTQEQINTALGMQKSEKKTQGKVRFIGQILQETANVSDDDILQILLDQKQFEKRRLDLEKALYSVKAEIKISKKLNKFFEYNISRDGLEAFVKKRVEIDEKIPVYEFLIWLRRAGVKFGVVNDTVLEEFIHKAEKKSQLLIAKGYPPEQCINEDIQFYFENEFTNKQQESDAEEAEAEEPDAEKPDNTESKQIEPVETESKKTEEPEKNENTEDNSEEKTAKENPEEIETGKDEDEDEESDNQKVENGQEEKNSSEPVFIKKGTLIAQIVPGEKGKPGKDVLGYPIQAKQPSNYILNAGSGVIKKGTIFIAQIDGRPLLKNPTTIMVEPVAKATNIKTITGNISCDTKNNYESAKVEMIGNITWEAIVKCHSLVLLGSLFGSVTATGKIEVKGNIGTDKKQKDQDIVHNACIICQGSVKVSKSIINSDIKTAGELLAANSTVTGSQVVALKGMTIQNVLKGEHAQSTLWFGIQPNDKIIAIDHTLDIKNSDLSILQKKDDIAELKEKYTKDLKEETHEFEQAILKNLIEIIKAPELFQSEGLKGKLRYLYGLPEFSSIRAYYLKIPETDAALEFLDQIMTLTKDMTLEDISDHIQKKIDPEPEEEESDEDAVSNIERIEIEFKARLGAFEQEIADESQKIEKIEHEIKGLQALRKKLGLMYLTALSKSTSTINIKNRCEKGTIIKGKIAKHVVEKTVYNVIFKEIIDPGTNRVFISLETY
jgi:uncharacterized protein (DUF342 family)